MYFSLTSKGPRYLILQHFSRPRYIINHNTHKSNNYFLNIVFFAHIDIPYF